MFLWQRLAASVEALQPGRLTGCLAALIIGPLALWDWCQQVVIRPGDTLQIVDYSADADSVASKGIELLSARCSSKGVR